MKFVIDKEINMVTILMAVYNGEEYIEKQLQSIKEQTYSNWRLIVRDDLSNDRSMQILEEFKNNVSNEVIIKQNNPGSGSAKNNFARLLNDAADSEYIMFSDQDDIWKRDKIKRTLNAMKKLEHNNKDVPLLVHGDVEVVDVSGNIMAGSMFELSHIPAVQSLSGLLIQNNVTGCTMMINSALLNSVKNIAGDERIIMHDYLMALYAAVFGKTAVIDKPLLSYRQHGDNSVGAKNNNSISYLISRLKDGRKQYKDAMNASRRQIALFLEAYGSDMKKNNKLEEYSLMKKYSDSGSYNHLKRIWFYCKYRVWKNGFIRKIMQCIWG